MITQAQSSSTEYKNITFAVGSAEDLSEVEDGTLDMVVAGQAAHWFDYNKVWPEINKKMRKGGTLAFWGYKDNVFVDSPVATKILDEYCYGPTTMGPYWEKTGRNLLRNLYREIMPPESEWEDIQRVEYEPGTQGKGSGKGDLLMEKRLKLGEMEGYARTFSSYHNWKAANEGKKDLVDSMFEEMREKEPKWNEQGENWRDFEVEIEWGSIILLARKK
jgi:SAM-dependent methyltransferase